MKSKSISKFFFFLITTILIIGLLTACERSKENEGLVSGETVYFRLSEIHPPEHPATQGDLEFARLVEEKTEGRIIIKVYHSGALGGESEVMEQVLFGGIDFARISIGRLTEIAPQLNVLQLPYLYKDGEHMWRVLNSEIGDYFLESIQEINLIGLTWFDAGARNFYNRIKEVQRLGDLQGMKMRVMESQLLLDTATALGIDAYALPYGDVFSSIQRGLIDGAENNFPSYVTSGDYQVASYYTLDEHMRIPEIVIASDAILTKITKSDLEIIKECAKEAQLYQRENWALQEKLSQDKLKEAGVVISQIEDRDEFIKAVTPIYELYAKDYAEIIEQIRSMEDETK